MPVAAPRLDHPGHRLVTDQGAPFTYLADTAWELFHRPTWDEAEHYLRHRAAQGFTAFQAVILPEIDGLRVPNANGDLPLYDQDPTRPNEAWFRHVDRVVDRAAELGLVAGLLPTWGDKWHRANGAGPEIFTPDNAHAFGRFLGSRYRDRAVLWILGGDRKVVTPLHRAILDGMAAGIRAGGATQPMTFHPLGWSCSWEHIDHAAWCDIHQWQSGHTIQQPASDRFADRTWPRTGGLMWDGEPIYENHPRMLARWNDHRGRYDASEVRHQAWLSVLAGSCGHVYGHNSIWQFFEPGVREGINKPAVPWPEALHAEGAKQMRHLRWFLDHRHLDGRQPAQDLIRRDDAQDVGIRALVNPQHGWAAIYTQWGEHFRFDLSLFGSAPLLARWYNPRTGTGEALRRISATDDIEWTPPYSDDWLLLINVAARNHGSPPTWR